MSDLTQSETNQDAGQGQQDQSENAPKIIEFEDGVVTLDGEELPGIMTDLRVAGSVRFDEQEVDGQSGKSKTPQGFEDCAVSLGLDLLTDSETDCYEKLEALNKCFQNVDNNANPMICTAVSRHLLARGIRQVVFSKLESIEIDADDYIRASLGFVEHNPPIVRTEKNQAKTPTASELAEQAETAAENVNPEAEKVIEVDLN